MNEEWEKLLANGLLSVPDNFAARVMQEINRMPPPVPKKAWPQYLQWLAVLVPAAFGAAEAFSFMLAIWTTGTAY